MRKRLLIAFIAAIVFAFGALAACGNANDNGGGEAVTGITLSSTELSIAVGEDVTLTATVSPESAKDTAVTWTVSDSNIATVTATGASTTVHGAAVGGPVTVTATCGGKTATCSVTVSDPSTVLKSALTATKSIDVGTMESSVTRTATAKGDATGHPYEKAYTGTQTATINMETGAAYQQASGKVTMSDSATQQDRDITSYTEWADGTQSIYYKEAAAENWASYSRELTEAQFKSEMLKTGLGPLYGKYAANNVTDTNEFKSLENLTSLFTYANGKYTARLNYIYEADTYYYPFIDIISADVEFTVAGGKIKTAKFEMSGDIHVVVSTPSSDWASLASYEYTLNITLGESGEIGLSSEDEQAIAGVKAYRKIFTDTLSAPQLKMTDENGFLGGSFAIDTAGKKAQYGENYYALDGDECWEYETDGSAWTKRKYNASDMTELAAALTEYVARQFKYLATSDYTVGANGVYTIVMDSFGSDQNVSMTVADGKIAKLQMGAETVTFAYDATVTLPNGIDDAEVDLKPTEAQWIQAARELNEATNITIKINGVNFIELDDVHGTAKKTVSATAAEYYEYDGGAYKYYQDNGKWLKGAAEGDSAEYMLQMLLWCEELEWLSNIEDMYSYFEYDSAKDAMVAQPAPNTTVTVKFVDFKAASVKINDDEYTFEYGNTTVTIPQDVKDTAAADKNFSEAQWQSILSSTMSAGNLTVKQDGKVTLKLDDAHGTAMEVRFGTGETVYNDYYEFANGTAYKYSQSENTWTRSQADGNSAAEMLGQVLYNSYGWVGEEFYDAYKMLKYDEASDSYKMKIEAGGGVMQDISFKISGGKLTEITVSYQAQSMSYTVEYGNTTVTIPQDVKDNAVVDNKISQQKWENALKALRNPTNVIIKESDVKVPEYVMAEFNAATNTVMFRDRPNDDPVYYVYDSGRTYKYEKSGSIWIKSEAEYPNREEMFMNLIREYFPPLSDLYDIYNSLVYDSVNDTYTYNGQAAITFTVKDGRIASAVYQGVTDKFTYGESTIVVPEEVSANAVTVNKLNQQQWYDAFDFLKNDRESVFSVSGGTSVKVSYIDKIAEINGVYYTEEAGKFYKYENDGTKWTKRPENYETFSEMLDRVLGQLEMMEIFGRIQYSYNEAVYNVELDEYTVPVEVYDDNIGNYVEVAVTVKFDANNKLASIAVENDATYVFAYTDVQVVLPSDAANAEVDNSLTYEQWNSALMLYGNDQFTVTKNDAKIIAYYSDRQSPFRYVMVTEAGSPVYYELDQQKDATTRYVQIESKWYSHDMGYIDLVSAARRPIETMLNDLYNSYEAFEFDKNKTYTLKADENTVLATVVIDNFKVSSIVYGTDTYSFEYQCSYPVIPDDALKAEPAESVDQEVWRSYFESMIDHDTNTFKTDKTQVSLNNDVIYALDKTAEKVFGKSGTNEGYVIHEGGIYKRYTKYAEETWTVEEVTVDGYNQFVRDYFSTIGNMLSMVGQINDPIIAVGDMYYAIVYMNDDKTGNIVSVALTATIENDLVKTLTIGEDAYVFEYENVEITPPTVTEQPQA